MPRIQNGFTARSEAAAAQFRADCEVLDAAAPQIVHALGFMPRDGLVSILGQSFRCLGGSFIMAQAGVQDAAELGDLDRLDLAEARFRKDRDALAAEIRRYQIAAGAVWRTACEMGNTKLADRALAVTLDLGNYHTHVTRTCAYRVDA